MPLLAEVADANEQNHDASNSRNIALAIAAERHPAGPRFIAQHPPTERPNVTAHRIDLWITSISVGSATLTSDRPLLDAIEMRRVKQFKRPADAHRWLRARATMKRILSRYLLCTPADVRFAYGSNGKPSALSADGVPGPYFNLSHSGDSMLLAVSAAFAVGVDIEQLRPLDDMATIAHRFFTPSEKRALMALPLDARLLAFFRCWARKEAVIKADGAGLSLPLDAFAVSLQDEVRSRVQWSDAWNGSRPPLEIVDVTTGTKHVAALAVPADARFESHWQDAKVLENPT